MNSTDNGHRGKDSPEQGASFNPQQFVRDLRSNMFDSIPVESTSVGPTQSEARGLRDRGFRGLWDDQIRDAAIVYIAMCVALLVAEKLVGIAAVRNFLLFGLPSAFFVYRVFRCKSRDWRVADWLAMLAIAYVDCGYLLWALQQVTKLR